MSTHSLTRRAVAFVLVTELICALALAVASIWYESRSRLHAFDVMLQGRSDSVLGAVQDAEDPEDNVTVDPIELRLPDRDVYAVYSESGRRIGSSTNPPAALVARYGDGIRSVVVDGHRYRVIERQGLRIIDRDETGGVGLRRPVTIIYASPIDHMWHEIVEAAGFYIGVSLGLICLTAIILVIALRKLLSPLKELAAEAAKVEAHSIEFTPPQSALQVMELRPLAEALSETIRRLQHALRMQHQFLSDAAHELKTAVAVERSTVQLLTLRPRSAEEYSEGLGRVLQDNERLEQLVSRMLTLARFEEQPPNSSVAIDVGRSALRTTESLRPWIESRGVTLSTDIQENINVPLSEETAEVLLSNLLMNAVQHSASGTEVLVSVRPSPEAEYAAVLKVEDAGGGISPENLPYVFDRFYREDRSRSRATGGAGLGLAICKSIVEGVGGVIRIESTPGRGTTAIAILPLVQNETACSVSAGAANSGA